MHEVQLPPIRPGSYAAPASISDALEILGRHGSTARVIAGGTDLMVEMDRRIGGEVQVLVDITRIGGLDTIAVRDGRVHLGPLVTHNQCATSDLVTKHGLALAQASLEVGSPALRNRATVAGNVVTASPANDTISALRALEADVTITSLSGARTVALADFHTGVRGTVLAPGELLTDISFPLRSADSRSVFVKLGLRKAQAISVVHLAIRCDLDHGGVVIDAAIALGSVAPTIVRATDAEAALVGSVLTPNTIAASAALAAEAVSPIDDLRAPAEYRNDLIPVMMTRALEALAADQHGDAHPEAPPTLGGPNLVSDGVSVDTSADATVVTQLNDQTVSAPWTPTSLLDWIREQAQLPGTKEGCAEGECGACTVHLDGVATLSCLVPAGRAHQAQLTTIEGLATDSLHPVQEAFINEAAVQCGYCIPGFLMAGAALQSECPEPSSEQLQLGLSGNLCRCTGYYNIEAAFTAEANQ